MFGALPASVCVSLPVDHLLPHLCCFFICLLFNAKKKKKKKRKESVVLSHADSKFLQQNISHSRSPLIL